MHFYVEVLGCQEERRVESLGLIQLRAGDGMIDLVPVDGPLGRPGGSAPEREGRNLDHFALALGQFEPEAIGGWLREHGIEPGEVDRRYGAGGYGPSMYIEDPDGNVVELKGPPDEER